MKKRRFGIVCTLLILFCLGKTDVLTEDIQVWAYQGDVCYYSMDKKFGLMRGDEVLLEPVFEEVQPFRNGLATVKKDKYWGVINPNGEVVYDFSSETPIHFYEDMGCVQKGENRIFVNRKGEEVFTMDSYTGVFSEGLLSANVKGTARNIYVDKTGRKIIDVGESVYALEFSEGYARIVMPKGSYLIDKDGKAAFEEVSSRLSEFHEGVSAIYVDGLYGYMDNTGEMKIRPQWKNADDFGEGFAAVMSTETTSELYEGTGDEDGGPWGFIDKQGNLVIDYYWLRTRPFREGLAAVQDPENGLWGFIDKAGNYVLLPQWNSVGSFYDGCAYTFTREEDRDLWGYINQWGEYLLQAEL